MKYAKIFLVASSLTLFGAACTDLTETLNSDFTQEFTPNNPGFGESSNVNGAIPADGLNAAYNGLRSGTANHGSYFSVQGISSDEMVITQKGGDWFDGGIWLNMHKHNFTPTAGGINGAWADNYGGITQSNLLLESGKLDANQAAQVRVLRAFYHWRLMDMFGRIKVVTSSTGTSSQVDRAVTYGVIVSELEAAIEDLADDNGYGRVDKYAALGLLARVKLNAEVYTRPAPYVAGTGTPDYQGVIDATDEIINSGLFALDPDFKAVFAPDNVNNIEHIFIVPFDEATGPGMNFAQMTLHYPSQLTFDLQQQPWNGYSTLEAFYNSFSDSDKRKAASFISGPQFDVNGNPILDVAFDKADPDGAAINYTPAINELAPNGSRQAGARMGKFSFKLGQLPEMDNDYTIIRYADVLLMKAEAVARLNGNWSHPTTLALVNQVRERAGVSPVTSLTADEFLAERGREMFQESIRRTDLIRFDKWGAAWWEKPAHTSSFKNVMPIPIDQLNADPTLTQNSGY